MNTVKKGANRATAAARTNRHAQRTPLPPRPGDVADAKEVLEFARHNPLNPGGVSVSAILGAAAEAAIEASDPRSHSKAHAFGELAVASKWDVATAVHSNSVELTARRGPETIVQMWRNGVWQYAESVYAYGDRVTKPRNASGTSKLLGRSPEDAAREASKVASNKSFRKAEPRDLAKTLESAQMALPFSPGDSDAAIIDAVKGHSIEWYNRISRKAEDGIVGPGRHLRIIEMEDGERVLLFCCPRNGFRSCLLSAVLSVGGKYALKEEA